PRELVAVHRHGPLRRAAELAEDLGRVQDRPVVAARAARVIDAARLARYGALGEEGLSLQAPPRVRRREQATELLRDAEVAHQRLERLVVSGARGLGALVERQADDHAVAVRRAGHEDRGALGAHEVARELAAVGDLAARSPRAEKLAPDAGRAPGSRVRPVRLSVAT